MKRSEPEETHEHLSSSEIIEIVDDIYNSKMPTKEKLVYYEKKYTDFSKHYDHIFKFACESDFDYKRFRYMMDMRDNIFVNKTETVETASVKVGQVLYDQFVKPKIAKS